MQTFEQIQKTSFAPCLETNNIFFTTIKKIHFYFRNKQYLIDNYKKNSI